MPWRQHQFGWTTWRARGNARASASAAKQPACWGHYVAVSRDKLSKSEMELVSFALTLRGDLDNCKIMGPGMFAANRRVRECPVLQGLETV